MHFRTIGFCLLALALAGCSSTGGVPAQYKVKLETSKGDVVIEVTREWSPLGADRFHELVKTGVFDDARFFRVVPGFVVQFGLKGDPAVDAKWSDANIQDDPPSQSNTPGTISFATRGPNTRSSQLFINLGNNASLDSMGFTPFGRVVEGMSVVTSLHSGYGDGPPGGMGPDQSRIKSDGNAYLKRDFPQLDFIKKATILP